MSKCHRQVPRSIAGLLFVVAGLAQNYPPPFPRDDARKLLENDRVAVWDVVWQKNSPSPLHQHRFDQISVTLVGGAVRVTKLDRSSTVNQSKIGSVTLTPKGTVHSEEGLSDIPQHKIMVELKSSAEQAVADRAPANSPIDGAVKLMENERVVAWDYTWKPGQKVTHHANGRDSVWVFLEGGKFLAVTRKAGQAAYMPAAREAYTEEAAQGTPRAIIIELK